MRKISVYVSALSENPTLSRRDPSEWLPAIRSYGYEDFAGRTDTVILGRKTYESVCRRNSGNPFSGKRCIVFSRTRAGHRDRYADRKSVV